MSSIRVCSFESRRADDIRSLIERNGGVCTNAPSLRELPRIRPSSPLPIDCLPAMWMSWFL